MADITKLKVEDTTYDIKDDVSRKNTIYSTSETVVGKWINNKPIYRKVINFDGNDLNVSKAHGISNIDLITNAYGILHHSYGWKPITTYYIDNGQISDYFAISLYGVDATNLDIRAGGWYSTITVFNDSFIILEYTKSTD